MDDSLHGRRDKRGNWRPLKPITYPPVFVWPARPRAFLRWLPEYLLPWNALYALIAVLFWLYASPPLEAVARLELWAVAVVLARNAALIVLFFGAFHLGLYVRKAQGTAFKYNGRWPDRGDDFLFGDQTADNLLRTFTSGLPVWTAYEVATLWMFGNGYVPYVSFAEHPYYGAALMLAVVAFREVHFYLIHRLIHWPPLYRTVHKVHHANVNPGPWSGLAMHPVEHLLYFSAVLVHWVVPSHPVHALFNLVHLGLAPAPGHAGFDKIVVGGDRAVDMHGYAHYLHHKYFECNYADGVIPLDRWFGSFHDGTDAAQAAMDARFMARAAAARARAAKRQRARA